MTNASDLIRVIDDNPDVLKSLSFLLQEAGYEVATYNTAWDFLKMDAPSVSGCLIVDLKMPEISGLELQNELKKRSFPHPIIFLTAHGEIEIAVHAIKNGAYEFLQKPINPEKLLEVLSKALQEDKKHLIEHEKLLSRALPKITKREQQICKLASRGLSNKEIAELIGCGERTVEGHISSIYKKLDIHNRRELKKIF